MESVIVGAGPNGLSAAIALARAGVSVTLFEAKDSLGGGVRSEELTLPGYVHDVCSAVYPLAVASPAFREFELERHGLQWIHAPIPLAHPLDDGEVVTLERSVADTAQGLGADGERYQRLMGPLAGTFVDWIDDALKPIGWPRHPMSMLRLGWLGIQSARELGDASFQHTRARALWAGLAAHSFLPLDAAGSAAFGLVLAAAAHAVGWPIARGGARRVTEALTDCLREEGASTVTRRAVAHLDELPAWRSVLLDVSPRQLLAIAGDRLAAGERRELERFRHGPGVFKLDWALDGAIPWRNPACGEAATVHLGGTFEEIAASERAASLGGHCERPFVVLSQPSRFDPSRAPAGRHTAWAYCHVPHGTQEDMTDEIEAQIERFAPGFRRRILKRATLSPYQLERHDANLIGGDISGGANDLRQMMLRPTRRMYQTTARGVYLCSASTPPGGGVHGMCGYECARVVLRDCARELREGGRRDRVRRGEEAVAAGVTSHGA